jgi:hypothetical protein
LELFEIAMSRNFLERLEQPLTANQCSQKKLATVELLNQFIEDARVNEKIKHPSTNRTLGYLAKCQKWLGSFLTNDDRCHTDNP